MTKLLQKIVRQSRANGGIEVRFRLLVALSRLIMPEYRFKWPQLDWWNDAAFTSFLRQFREHRGMNADRKWMLHQLLRLTSEVDGDTAECGTFRGASSWLICHANAANPRRPRTHHVFDSFEGLSQPGKGDGAYWTQGQLACSLDVVQRNLSAFPAVTCHKGWIPERFPEVQDHTFSFVHIDVDLQQPTWDSLVFFYERMSQGGIILCDDYGFSTCPGATEAVDQFLKDKPEGMLALPDGGGFLIKGIPSPAHPLAIS